MLGLEHSSAAIVGTLDIAALQAGVVRITATPSGEPQKVGTGFIVRLERDVIYIVTAAHVVSGDAQPKVQFFTQPDVSAQAIVKHSEGGDEVTGLALLVVRGKDNLPSGLTALTLTSAPRMSGNDEIILIGHPRGAGDWAILRGSIASRQGRYVIVDANIDEGNSGGPIIQNGEVVGIVGGVTRYGRGVTSGSVREYLEGHGISSQEVPAPVAKVQPTPSIPITPEKPVTAPGPEIIGKDGAPMVLIPAGEFWMGSTDQDVKNAATLLCEPEHELVLSSEISRCKAWLRLENEKPLHRVYLDSYYVDRFEVTVFRYAEFIRLSGRNAPDGWNKMRDGKQDNFPVVGVNWQDAEAYCSWAGKRLPTEAEWEKAGRGTDRRTFPWGNEKPTAELANLPKKTGHPMLSTLSKLELVPVESYDGGRSPYGLFHMAGNAGEWVADWYHENYYSKSPTRNPKGPLTGESRVIRGPGKEHVISPISSDLRTANRTYDAPTSGRDNYGFRCAQDAPQ
jgi:formylglycine-generating enzyme required for sulfatase activity